MQPAFSRTPSAWRAAEEAAPAPWRRAFYLARLSSSRCFRSWRAQSKGPPAVRVGPPTQKEMRLGCELPQHVAVLLLQLAERPVAKLANPLACYPHHPADLFQSPAIAIIEAEIEPEHLGVARWQCRQRQLEIVGSAAGQG